jgi:glucuronate isomerase
MKRFLDDDFLLDGKLAIDLYETWARRQPIIDYHCHLPPDQIADNHRFRSLSELWLEGDHYKWRAMRASGIPERSITGDASDWEKFEAWAATVPDTLRNPLYHWTHLELRFPFGVTGQLLGPSTARAIYDRCNVRLAEEEFTAQGLLAQYGVKVVCSTDDPVDDLEAHRRHARAAGAATQLLPTWRPDQALALHDLGHWNRWVNRLEAASGTSIDGLTPFLEALGRRHEFFHQSGCRSSDHGLDRLWSADYTQREAEALFARARAASGDDSGGAWLSPDEIERLRSALLYELAVMDHARGWVQQFHLGALRNNSTRALRAIGPDAGCDAIGDLPQAAALVRFLDRLDREGRLAKTILYNLNPADNEVFASIIGSFQDGSVAGKMQYGSAWWFLDQADGMLRQLDTLSNLGLLSRFVGMLTDSRSFLSYSRHDYFRRLLCNLLGQDVEKGLLPHEPELLGKLVTDVCFRNARDYFQFSL